MGNGMGMYHMYAAQRAHGTYMQCMWGGEASTSRKHMGVPLLRGTGDGARFMDLSILRPDEGRELNWPWLYINTLWLRNHVTILLYGIS